MNELLERLSRYGLKKINSDRYVCRCPAHDDKSPSMSVMLQHDDKTLVHCFAGCHPEDILSSLGLTMSDLFPDDDSFDWESYQKKKETIFKREQFMSDYVLITLAESDIRKNKTFSDHDKKVFKEAVDRVNQYKFDAHEVYKKLIRQEAMEAALEQSLYQWNLKSFEEKYGL